MVPSRKNAKKRPREQRVAPRLNKEQEEAFRVAFGRAEKNGMIQIKDAKSALQSLGISVRTEDIISFLSPGNDTLDLSLFSEIASITLEQKQLSETAFDYFDRDGKGVICLEDLQRVTVELGEDYSDEMLHEMVDEADLSGEGFISKDDFYRIVRKINL